MSEHLPDRFNIVCTGKAGDEFRHERQIVYYREVDLDRGIMRTSRKSWPDGVNDPGSTVDRLSTTELRCSACGLTQRWPDVDLSRLIGASSSRAARAPEPTRQALMNQELSGIAATMRAIR